MVTLPASILFFSGFLIAFASYEMAKWANLDVYQYTLASNVGYPAFLIAMIVIEWVRWKSET